MSGGATSEGAAKYLGACSAGWLQIGARRSGDCWGAEPGMALPRRRGGALRASLNAMWNIGEGSGGGWVFAGCWKRRGADWN